MTEPQLIEAKHADDVVAMSALSDLVKSAVTPFAESQTVVAQEATKQTEIVASTKLKMFWGVCVLAALIIGLAGYALYLGQNDITEKVLIAIVSFLGGLGVGKQSGKG